MALRVPPSEAQCARRTAPAGPPSTWMGQLEGTVPITHGPGGAAPGLCGVWEQPEHGRRAPLPGRPAGPRALLGPGPRSVSRQGLNPKLTHGGAAGRHPTLRESVARPAGTLGGPRGLVHLEVDPAPRGDADAAPHAGGLPRDPRAGGRRVAGSWIATSVFPRRTPHRRGAAGTAASPGRR